MDNVQKSLNLLTHIQERSDVFEYLHEDILNNVSIAEAHFVDYIAKHKDSNATEIARALRLTKGAVSKIYKKLVLKGLIVRYQDPKNAKEIFFSLTETGTILFEKHLAIHQQAEKKWVEFLSTYSDSEQEIIVRFLSELDELYPNENVVDGNLQNSI